VILLSAHPDWHWAECKCDECGLTVREEFDRRQSMRFTARTAEAKLGRQAVADRLREFFREKGCPHVRG
jgi:hypothetical protein